MSMEEAISMLQLLTPPSATNSPTQARLSPLCRRSLTAGSIRAVQDPGSATQDAAAADVHARQRHAEPHISGFVAKQLLAPGGNPKRRRRDAAITGHECGAVLTPPDK